MLSAENSCRILTSLNPGSFSSFGAHNGVDFTTTNRVRLGLFVIAVVFDEGECVNEDELGDDGVAADVVVEIVDINDRAP